MTIDTGHIQAVTPPAGGDPPPVEPPAYAPPASQADLDRIIAQRLSRQREQFADYSELKAAAVELAAIKESSASDTEKAVTKARLEGAQEAATKANARVVRSEIKAAAAALGFADPSDAVALYGDTSTVRVADDGTVDEAAIKTRLQEIATAKPYLKGSSTSTTDFDVGPRQTPPRTRGAAGQAELEKRFGKPAGSQ